MGVGHNLRNFNRILGTLLLILVSFFAGFWVRDHQLFVETDWGQGLYQFSQFLQPPASSKPPQEAVQSLEQRIYSHEIKTADNYDLVLIESQILEKINNLRESLGLQDVSSNTTLQEAARLRAKESAVSFSHTRPDGRDPFTVLNDEFSYSYLAVGENLGMATLLQDEAYMSDWLFQEWTASQGHYDTMVNPHFTEVGVGAYIEDGVLYSAQMFGLPQS